MCRGRPSFTVAGVLRTWRAVQPVYGWDIIDETDARRHGWLTKSDPGIVIIHHRMQGAALGTLRGRIIWGRGAYAIGSRPLFAIARGLFRMLERPRLEGGLIFSGASFPATSTLNCGE